MLNIYIPCIARTVSDLLISPRVPIVYFPPMTYFATGLFAFALNAHLLTLAMPQAQDPPPQIEMASRPERVFKTDDAGPEGTESWAFDLVLTGNGDHAPEVTEIVEELLSNGRVLAKRTVSAAGIEGTATRAPTPAPGHTRWAGRFRYSTPLSWHIDQVRLAVRLESGRVQATFDVSSYEQTADLVFPFVGPGVVTSGGVSNGGHRHPSGQFAVDAIGLTEMYAPQTGVEDLNEFYAGWGRAIVAPGDGTVVWAQRGVPDQARPNANERASFTLTDGTVAFTGNSIVIDHGGGEYSVLMHMMSGSLLVGVGDRVHQGQPVGRLGSSGDSFGPHIHYQLQDAPVPLQGSALPVRFRNMPALLVRGVWFDAQSAEDVGPNSAGRKESAQVETLARPAIDSGSHRTRRDAPRVSSFGQSS